MKRVLLISGSVFLLLSACRNEDPNKGIRAHFEKEIKNRCEQLSKLEVTNDSLKVNCQALNEEINNIILLSRDIENLGAAVSRANGYFLNLSHTYGLNYSDFTELNTGMHVNDIAAILKQNELNFLNQLLLKIDPNQTIPFTAQ